MNSLEASIESLTAEYTALNSTRGAPDRVERFVDSLTAAKFLSIKPRYLLELARAGRIPGYPIRTGTRGVWRFRLSDLSTSICALNQTKH